MARVTMVCDAIRRTMRLVVTVLVLQSVSAGLDQRPAIPGVAPESSRSPGPDQYNPLAVPLDTIEDHPDPFLGRDVSVHAEVEEVLGPRVFTIDEPDWADFDNEVLVILPSEGLAIVREDDRITVTGRLLSAADAALDEASPPITLDRQDDMADRSVIIATRIDVHEQRTALSAGTPRHSFSSTRLLSSLRHNT